MRPQVVKFVAECDHSIRTWRRFLFVDKCFFFFFLGMAVVSGIYAWADYSWWRCLLPVYQLGFAGFEFFVWMPRSRRQLHRWQRLRHAAMQFDASHTHNAAMCNWDQLEAAVNEFATK